MSSEDTKQEADVVYVYEDIVAKSRSNQDPFPPLLQTRNQQVESVNAQLEQVRNTAVIASTVLRSYGANLQ